MLSSRPPEDFSAESLLLTVGALLEPGLMRVGLTH